MGREFKVTGSMQFKKILVFSALWHVVVFFIFSLTFAKRIIGVNYSSVTFLGNIFQNIKYYSNSEVRSNRNISSKADSFLINSTERNNLLTKESYFKPLNPIELENKKVALVDYGSINSFLSHKQESPLMFYPRLPNYFPLYFKDRQIVHIELMFKIISLDQMNSVLLKRKISSGNLEVDLLAKRYIGHYLFIQQTRFPTNNWQKIKIELSPQNK